MPARGSIDRRRVAAATVTPLASIFGSGFLIIVPVLERTLGVLSLLGAIAVCSIAWFVGTAIRHCVRVVEPRADEGKLDLVTHRLDRAGDAVIVVAYVISVALYLRIMAQYLVDFAVDGGSPAAERLIACATVALIIGVAIGRGLHGLDLLERSSLAAVLLLVTLLGVALLVDEIGSLMGPGISLPPGPPVGFFDSLLVLGGIVITVQGFETVRYLGGRYDAETRIWASRVAQIVSAAIYIGFVAVATPVMGLGTKAGADATLLDVTHRVAPILALPLVTCAVLSQFSAATADTAAADGNLRGLSDWMRSPRSFLVSGGAAIALAATVETFTIIAVASRAFAAYYAIQAVIALRTSEGLARKGAYAALAVAMTLVTLLARPAG